MEHHYYSMLRKIERLAKNRMSAGSDENRTHYRLLVYKISYRYGVGGEPLHQERQYGAF